jgi:hypothetical protein
MGGSVMAVVINGTTGIDKVQDGSIGTADIAADAITTPKIANSVNLGRRNLFMNGDFQIAQRGTSHTYSNGQSGFHSLDRIYSANFSSGTLALSQQHAGHDNVDAPKFLRATTASTVGASATVYSRQAIEGIEQFSNKQVTISFMVKANTATTFQLRREYYYGSSSTEYSGFVDVPVTTSWTKFTHTYDAVDFSSKTIGSANYWSVLFYWSTDQGSNKVRDGNIDITNVQMEIGTEATTFERLSYAEQQTLCQRYCQVWSEGGDALIFAGKGQGTTAIDFGWPLAVPLRASPTLSQTGTGWRAFRPSSNLVSSTATPAVTRFGVTHPFICLRVSSFPSSSFSNNYAVNIGPQALTKFIFDSEL